MARQALRKFAWWLLSIAIGCVLVCIPLLIYAYYNLGTGCQLLSKPMMVEGDLRALSQCLRTFENLNGSLPTEKEGLEALMKKPARNRDLHWYQLLKEVPVDPWGHAYQYRLLPGPVDGYDLFSLGRDGKPSDDDIYLPQSKTFAD